MKTKIVEYDLLKPNQPVWGLDGYTHTWMLVRAGRRPLGWLAVPLGAWQTALLPEQMAEWLATRLDLLLAAPGLASEASGAAAPAPRPGISVIVCTRDRPHSLRRCLAALARLDYAPFEVIVVDNASRTAATAETVAATSFRYVREDRPGLDWARNRGAAEARYSLLAYVDDDVLVDPGWLDGVAQAFADPTVAAMTGLVVPAELETPAQHLFEQYGGMTKGFTARLLEPANLADDDLIAAHHVGVGANMAFRRSTLAALGGFDTALDVGTPSCGAGDLDMFHRVLAAGLTLRYEPRALAWHEHRRDVEGLKRQLAYNGRAFTVYLLKLWRMRSVPRRAVARYAVSWAGGWLLRRLVSRLLGRYHFPLSLILAEIWGACQGPWAFYDTYRRDRALRGAAAEAA